MMQPRDLLLALAIAHGVGDEVRALLKDRPEPPLPSSLGDLLTKVRNMQELSRADVVRRGGPCATQSRWYEERQTRNPGVRTINMIAEGYGLPFSLVLFAVMRDAGLMIENDAPAPGAKAVVRRRKRLTKAA